WLHRQTNFPVVHDISDLAAPTHDLSNGWFAFQDLRFSGRAKQGFHRLMRAGGRMILPGSRAPLRLEDSYFRSAYLKEKFLEMGETSAVVAPVIHHGVPSRDKLPGPGAKRGGIIFAGRLEPYKGAHVFLAALARLSPEHGPVEAKLIGDASSAEYREQLDQLIAAVPAFVSLHREGAVPREALLNMLDSSSIFVFPVSWPEPFSIGLLEAARAGLAIVATGTGGTPEILRDEENCLLVPVNDPSALAAAVDRLRADTALRHRLAEAARATAKEFTIESKLHLIEMHLRRVLARHGRAVDSSTATTLLHTAHPPETSISS
ncbi:MAG: glycosyltransferase family 4 protein, partial [Bryobacteraceae bacterium]